MYKENSTHQINFIQTNKIISIQLPLTWSKTNSQWTQSHSLSSHTYAKKGFVNKWRLNFPTLHTNAQIIKIKNIQINAPKRIRTCLQKLRGHGKFYKIRRTGNTHLQPTHAKQKDKETDFHLSLSLSLSLSSYSPPPSCPRLKGQ